MNPIIENKVGKNIRRLRKRANLTQEEIAIKLQIAGCDITRSAVAKIEANERHLYVDELILIKQILNTSYDELLALD